MSMNRTVMVAQITFHRTSSNLSLVEVKAVIMPIRKPGLLRLISTRKADMRINRGNYGRNDVNGDYSLTYLDLLSTMPLMRGEAEFEKAIDRVLSDILNFDRDVKVQVFEGQDWHSHERGNGSQSADTRSYSYDQDTRIPPIQLPAARRNRRASTCREASFITADQLGHAIPPTHIGLLIFRD